MACAAVVAATFAHAETASAPTPAASHARPAKPRLDVSGRKRIGKASVYAGKFDGRKMADGTPMNPQGDSAASKTLPLGTTARVTNLETGQSAVVTIRDRGPSVKGRIVDLSPATAEQVGIDRRKGVSKVEVAPLSVPSGAASAKRSTPPGARASRRPDPAAPMTSSAARRG